MPSQFLGGLRFTYRKEDARLVFVLVKSDFQDRAGCHGQAYSLARGVCSQPRMQPQTAKGAKTDAKEHTVRPFFFAFSFTSSRLRGSVFGAEMFQKYGRQSIPRPVLKGPTTSLGIADPPSRGEPEPMVLADGLVRAGRLGPYQKTLSGCPGCPRPGTAAALYCRHGQLIHPTSVAGPSDSAVGEF